MEAMTIETIRTDLNMTRQQLAEKLGMSEKRYNRLAKGTAKIYASEFIELHILSGIPYEKLIHAFM